MSIVERPRGCLVHPHPRCAETAEKSLSIFTSLDDPWHAALSKVLVSVEGVTGAFRERSDALLAEADEEFSREDDAWGRAVIGFVRLETAMKAGDVDTALRLGPATAAAFRQLEDLWGLSATLYHFGWGLRQFGRFEEGARSPGGGHRRRRVRRTVEHRAVGLRGPGHREGLTSETWGPRATCSTGRATASQEVGDGAGEVLAVHGYGLLAEVDADWPGARQRYEEAVRGFERLGTPVWAGIALAGQGRCAEALGELTAAGGLYEKALGRWAEAGGTQRDGGLARGCGTAGPGAGAA